MVYTTESPAAGPHTTPSRSWSATDGVWWLMGLAAIILAGAVRHLLPGDPDSLVHYAAGGPLACFFLFTLYWRLRLRAAWRDAVALGLSAFAVTLALGWWKGRS